MAYKPIRKNVEARWRGRSYRKHGKRIAILRERERAKIDRREDRRAR